MLLFEPVMLRTLAPCPITMWLCRTDGSMAAVSASRSPLRPWRAWAVILETAGSC